MKNYLISESQLKKILETIEVEQQMTLGDAMRKIVSTLRNEGYEDEQVVDFMIALRTGDPFIKQLSKKFELDPLFQMAVNRLLASVERSGVEV